VGSVGNALISGFDPLLLHILRDHVALEHEIESALTRQPSPPTTAA
jgi:hypothetical protein